MYVCMYEYIYIHGYIITFIDFSTVAYLEKKIKKAFSNSKNRYDFKKSYIQTIK